LILILLLILDEQVGGQEKIRSRSRSRIKIRSRRRAGEVREHEGKSALKRNLPQRNHP
jgi:hypothetical protein